MEKRKQRPPATAEWRWELASDGDAAVVQIAEPRELASDADAAVAQSAEPRELLSNSDDAYRHGRHGFPHL